MSRSRFQSEASAHCRARGGGATHLGGLRAPAEGAVVSQHHTLVPGNCRSGGSTRPPSACGTCPVTVPASPVPDGAGDTQGVCLEMRCSFHGWRGKPVPPSCRKRRSGLCPRRGLRHPRTASGCGAVRCMGPSHPSHPRGGLVTGRVGHPRGRGDVPGQEWKAEWPEGG